MQPQAVFRADYVEQRSRLTTFFRIILVIPHAIVLWLYGIVAAVCVVVAWFALVFTGRWPRGLYDLVAGYLRYQTAVYGYIALLTDAYPPFGPETGGYPVRLELPPPQPSYSRAKALFRLILAIPVFIILYAMQLVWEVGALLAWFAIVVLGRQPQALQEMIVLGLSYQQRASAYLLLVTEDWPPFSNPDAAALGGGPTPGAGLPEAPSPAGVGPEAPVTDYAPPSADR